MKKIIDEFRKFISRGNAMDMAVGAIIGAAFTAIVTALSNGILKPFINWLLFLICGGNTDALDKIYTVLVPSYISTVDDLGNITSTLDLSSSIYIDWGGLISSILNFIIVAVVLFFVIKVFNYTKELQDNLTDIKNITDFKLSKGLKLTKLEQRALEEYQKKQEEKEKAEKEKEPTTNELLKEIIDLMKEKNPDDAK